MRGSAQMFGRWLGRLLYRLGKIVAVLAALLDIFLLIVRIQIFLPIIEVAFANIIQPFLVEQQTAFVVS